MNVYAFDVDETLEISNGPVTLQSMMDLRVQGHIVGLCGNWGLFVMRVPGWQHLISFLNCSPVVQTTTGEVIGDKAWWLKHFKMYTPSAEKHILVGNVFGATNKLGFTCGSHDSAAAEAANWFFIKEDDFAEGVR